MRRVTLLLIAAAAGVVLGMAADARAAIDPAVLCQKTIVRELLKLKRSHLGNHIRCLERENKYSIPTSCPDARADLAIQRTIAQVEAQISGKCTMADLATLGYRTDCSYEAATSGKEGACAQLAVTTPAEFAQCLVCWKGAELAEFVALLYASHALEVCGGSLDETSPVCSALDCTTPLPDQLDLGNSGQNMCQRFIGNAGVRYLVNREKILERCLLSGGTKASCLADPTVQLGLARLLAMTQTTITNQCGDDRVPNPTLGFCCRCGTGQTAACTTVPATRAECLATDPSCTVQEGRTCNTGNGNCDPGPKQITWWTNCPESDSCPGPTLATLSDLIDCVAASADVIVDELLCLQFPSAYPCPPPD